MTSNTGSTHTRQPIFALLCMICTLSYIKTADSNASFTISELKRTLSHTPDDDITRLKLADTLLQKNEIESAIAHYRHLLTRNPKHYQARLRLGKIFSDRGQFTESYDHLAVAAAIRSNDPQLIIAYANVLHALGKPKQAMQWYHRLLNQFPDNSSALYGIAHVYQQIGSPTQEIDCYNKILSRRPDLTFAQYDRGRAYLRIGQWEQGWLEHEARLSKPLSPRWKPEDISGKRILIRAEQGYGDTFMFIRYARILKQMGAQEVIVTVQAPLQRFVTSCCPYIDTVINYEEQPPAHDLRASLLSLPYLLGTTLKTVPHETPYLRADPKLVAAKRALYANDQNLKVGLHWRANVYRNSPFAYPLSIARTIPLWILSTLTRVPGVTFYSLQKFGDGQLRQFEGNPADLGIVEPEDEFDESNGRFMDTAAMIQAFDLVISIDTATAHVAGGLGARTWVLIPHHSEWRWLMNRTNSPWYPSIRLFRQETPGDWKEVIARVVQELQTIVSERQQKAQHT